MHVRDAGASVRRHGEAARRHAGDDFVQREEQTAGTRHQVPRHAGQCCDALNPTSLLSFHHPSNLQCS